MSEERMIALVEEIRDLQQQQLQLSQENNRRYADALKSNEKAQSRARKVQMLFFGLMILVFFLLIYAEWFLDGVPKPSWAK